MVNYRQRAVGKASRWLHSHPTLHRHVFTARHLAANYRTVGGELDFVPSDLFLYELPQRKEFFRRAFHYLAFNHIDGDYAEFGCFSGMTFRMAWSATRMTDYSTHLWGFDSFAGLPQKADPADQHPQWEPGWLSMSVEDFHRVCRQAEIPADCYTVVPGYYEQSLTATNGPLPERISFAYVDCDMHSSTIDVLSFLETRLRPGSVIGFDDWFCYSPTGPSGERLAAMEHFASSRWSLVPFVQYGWHGMSFLVDDRDAVPPSPGGW